MIHWKLFILLVILFAVPGVGLTPISAQDLNEQVLVQKALATAGHLCAEIGRDQACYGHSLVDAWTQPDVDAFTFAQAGDIEAVTKLQSLRLSQMTVERGLWGIALMKLRANMPTSVAEDVTLLAFGSVELEHATTTQTGVDAPMQAFYFQSDIETGSKAAIPRSGLLIQTPEGAGEVTFLMNEVNIQIGSTIYFEAAPGGEMIVSTLEGKARVQAQGSEAVAIAGTRVRIPMTNDLRPAGPPSAPEPYNAEALSQLPLSLLGQQIVVQSPESALPDIGDTLFQPVNMLRTADTANVTHASGGDTNHTGNSAAGDDDDHSTTYDTSSNGGVTITDKGGSTDCENGNSCNAPGHNKDGDKDASDANDDKPDKPKPDKKPKK